ncbi:MAG TPA: hypothetical protein VE110_01980 [Gemmatimonadaceae bacterium]|jgi:hypothetical protein|nr:hypothetical protein [Gemmatimonadaceae bacterium]
MVKPADTDVTIAGVEVVIGVSSGSGALATTGGIKRSPAVAGCDKVVAMYPSIAALAIVAAIAPSRRLR